MLGDDQNLASYQAPLVQLGEQLGGVLDHDAALTARRRLGLRTTLTRGVPATPRSASGMVASGLVLAFMMSGSFTKRGSLRRRSVVMTAGRSTSSVSRPASTSRVTLRRGLGQLELRGERGLRAVPQRGQHLAGLVVVVVDGLLAEDDEERLFPLDQLEQHARAASGSSGASATTCSARCAPMASALRSVAWQSAGPMVATTTSSARPRSLMRSASSMAMASKGLMLSLTPSSTTPEPSGFTRMRTL